MCAEYRAWSEEARKRSECIKCRASSEEARGSSTRPGPTPRPIRVPRGRAPEPLPLLDPSYSVYKSGAASSGRPRLTALWSLTK